MYIRKSLLGGLTAAAGKTALAVLTVLFWFKGTQLPAIGEGAAWIGGLYSVLSGASRGYR